MPSFITSWSAGYSRLHEGHQRLFPFACQQEPQGQSLEHCTSEEGREMLVAAVSDEANLAKLDRYKEITARLADPRGLSDAEAQKLIAEGKPIYWATAASIPRNRLSGKC